jgi:hypothetical protein
MDEILWTTAYLLGVLGPGGPVKTGQLSLSKGVLTLERRGTRDPLFSVPVSEVRARFPRLYFGLGLKLITRGKRYRIWFVPLRWISTPGSSTVRGFYLKEVGPARAATQTWRTALSGTGT